MPLRREGFAPKTFPEGHNVLNPKVLEAARP